MGEVAALSPRSLAWATDTYLRDDTLTAANTAVVNFQSANPGRRLGPRRVLLVRRAALLMSRQERHPPTVAWRYHGHGAGLNLYSWTADTHTRYGSRVITARESESSVVLDGSWATRPNCPSP